MKYKWGIIGTGYIAGRMAANLRDHYSPAVAVAARNYDKTKKFAQKYQIQQAWPTPTELFADSAIDIVYIGTPSNTHYDFIKKALLVEKHVLCEKPMVINREQFLELVNFS